MRARRNPTKKTYTQLLTELRWLGPAVVMFLIEAGGTRQCQSAAQAVANYLQERGFAARTDAGAGCYWSHYDLAVYTADKGWVSVDPTYIQFHAPVNEDQASDFAEGDGYDMKSLSDEEWSRVMSRYFEPTVRWSVAAMRDGVKAFEIAPAPHVKKESAPSEYASPKSWGSYFPDTWQEYWEKRRQRARDLKKGLLPRRIPASRGYWMQEVSRRLRKP